MLLQVGQCGNQVGRRFWEMALAEHAAHNPEGIFDESMSTFFRNVDARYNTPFYLEIHCQRQEAALPTDLPTPTIAES